MSKRIFFSLTEKVKIINYADKNPHLSSRKLAEFGCCRTCIQTLLKQKEDILTDGVWCGVEILLLKRKKDLKNSTVSTMLSDVGFLWQRKY